MFRTASRRAGDVSLTQPDHYCGRDPLGIHDWVPVGHTTVDEADRSGDGPGTIEGSYKIALTDNHPYVIKACRHCDRVWWMRYGESGAYEPRRR